MREREPGDDRAATDGPSGPDADGSADVPPEAAPFDLAPGFAPEQVASLVAAGELEPVYPLLHALARGSVEHFTVRVAVLEALVEDGRASFPTAAVKEVLYWLSEPSRDRAIQTLRSSGWLEYRPTTGHQITDAGRFVAGILSLLRARVREESLLPSVEGIQYMVSLGMDPLRQLQLLRSQMENLRREMEAARSSHSEVILRAAEGRLGEALALSERIRAVLAKVPLERTHARRVAQEIHELLSRLHGVGSTLHAALTDIGRQYLRLVAGMKTADIVATLMRLPKEELEAVGREALFPAVPVPPLVVPELLAAEAEAYLARKREAPPEVAWKDPPEPERPTTTAEIPPEIAALLDDLDRLVQTGVPTSLREFLPRSTPGESFLRATLLPLLGETVGGEGVAGRLGAMPLTVRVDGTGLPEEAPAPLVAVTPGNIEPKRAEARRG
jgi:hypothetical protein